MLPRISVITICQDNLADLQATCRMVDAQTQPPFEHLIVDGSIGSKITDWLRNSPQPRWRKSIHEPDEGISDAFNKGILNTTGDVIHLHNSGDEYMDNRVLAQVSEVFTVHRNVEWLHGQYLQFVSAGWVVTGKPFSRKLLYRGMRQIGHPTMFLRRGLYERYGMFRLEKSVAMDYDLLARISRERFHFIARPLVRFVPGGVSNRLVWKGLREVIESHGRLHGDRIRPMFWALRTWFLHRLTRSGAGGKAFRIRNQGRIQ